MTSGRPDAVPEGGLSRPALLRRGVRLEAATVGWNVIEGLVAVMVLRPQGLLARVGALGAAG